MTYTHSPQHRKPLSLSDVLERTTVTTVHLIVNPAAGRGRGGRSLHSILQKIKEYRWQVNEYVTDRRGHASTIAAQLPDDGAPLLILGGDGTVNETINGLHDHSHPIGIIPVGTGNDFAGYLGLHTVTDTLHAVRYGKRLLTDAALVEVVEENGTATQRRFINTMGIGFDAAVAVDVQSIRLGSGILPYLFSVFRMLVRYKAVPATVTMPGSEISLSLFLASIGNGTTSGGGFRLTPDARVDDGLLDLCHVRSVPVHRALRLLPKALSGTHGRIPEVWMDRAAQFTITTKTSLPIHLDGEILTKQARQLRVTCTPAHFEFYVPPATGTIES